ncbi:MAG: ABC transporter permease [Anaerolineae bacterium]|nr:ABC transporter permease [Anaerolineae bacterium]
MRLKFAQVTGIARYEMKMLWRGRSLRVIMLALLVLSVVIAAITNQNKSAYPGDTVTMVGSMVWSVLSVVLAFVLPILVADIIPKDQQLGVNELLETLPLPRAVYLLGKLLGVYRSLFTGLIALMLIIKIGYGLLLVNIEWRGYLEMWVIGAGGLVILNGGLGVLLPAAQPNRRRAVVLMIGVFLLPFLIDGSMSPGAIAYLSPFRSPFLMYYLSSLNGSFASRFTANDIQLSFFAGLMELIIVGVAVWAWPRWRETRISGRE